MPDDTPADDGSGTPDLRFTEQEERHGIRVERNLSGGGHLARGDKTNMSRLSFSARARPADTGERDHSFTERPQERPPEARMEPAAPEQPSPAAEPEPAPGLLDRITRFFRR